MKFRIGEQEYDATAINDVSLRLLLVLEKESAELGGAIRMSDIQAWQAEMQALPVADRDKHPAVARLLAVNIWAARVLSGEKITFGDAIDFPLSQMQFIAEPGDAAPVEANPQKARPSSGRAAANRTSGPARSTTSGPLSVAG